MYKNYTKELGIPRRYIAKLLLIMRLTTIILIATLLQVSASTLAQKVSLSASNASLKSVLKDIRTQSGYDFVISESIIKAAKPITVNMKDVELKDALDKIFSGQNLTYSIDKTTIMVKEKDEPSFLDKLANLFNTTDVRGRVVDEKNQPVPGATVRVKDGKGAAVTDERGIFLIKQVAENSELIITYIGYKEKHINVNGDLINIRLEQSSSQLDEVQIQFAGITSRRLSTGDITSVKAADIEKQPINNPLLALQGKVPGLIVTPGSGAPGSAMKVQLRGQNSLAGLTSEPLYVVNGVPIANNINGLGGLSKGPFLADFSSLSFINPKDIESIDVLKDADATAVYGSRGANGVILITTKKGKVGPTIADVNISTSYGADPKFLKLMNTQQYLELRKESFKNDGINFTIAPYNTPSYKNQVAPDLFLWDQNKYVDWQKVILGGTAKNQEVQANISGGSETVQYTIGSNYNKQTYIFPGESKDENFKEYFSLTGKSIDQRFNINFTANIAHNNNTTYGSLLNAILLAPNTPDPYTANGQLNWEPNPTSLGGQGTWNNPYASLYNVNNAHTTMYGGTTFVSYQFLPSLVFKTTFGYNQLKGNSFTPNPLAAVDPATWQFANRSANFLETSSSSITVEPQLTYARNLSSGILTVLIGSNYSKQDLSSESLLAYGFSSDALLHNLGAAKGLFGGNTSSEYKYVGAYFRIGYNWNDKYILNLNGRRDGSSRFGPQNQYGNFGSLAGAWVFSNEKFIQSALSFLSFGKLRASYGITGNDNIQNYQYVEQYQNIDNATYGGLKTIKSSGVANPYFHWEQVKKLEFGLETGFLKDRILFTAVYFQNRSSNQLVNTQLPATAGQNFNFVANQNATIQNNGWEMTLSTTNVKSEHFSWRSAFNISIPRNKLIKADADISQYYSYILGTDPLGKPFSGVLNGYRQVDVDPATGQYQFTGTNENGTPGGVVHADGGPNPFASTTYFAPKYFGGLQNSFRYKKFELNVFLQFSKQLGKNYLFDDLFRLPGFFNINQSTEVENRWRSPGDVAQFQRSTQDFTLVSDFIASQHSQRAYVDASFIRLKNASLSYEVFEAGKLKSVKNLKIYVQGQNLFTWTKYNGTDPDVQNVLPIPQLRTIAFGLSLGL